MHNIYKFYRSNVVCCSPTYLPTALVLVFFFLLSLQIYHYHHHRHSVIFFLLSCWLDLAGSSDFSWEFEYYVDVDVDVDTHFIPMWKTSIKDIACRKKNILNRCWQTKRVLFSGMDWWMRVVMMIVGLYNNLSVCCIFYLKMYMYTHEHTWIILHRQLRIQNTPVFNADQVDLIVWLVSIIIYLCR